MLPELISRFVREDDGATVIEYGILALMMTLAMVGSVAIFGEAVANLFTAGNPAEVLNQQTQLLR